MLAAINPCGFAMLPAYLSFFVGAESDRADLERGPAVRRVVLVSLAVTAGFVLTFTAIGLVVVTVGSAILRRTPWITIVIGLALVALGIALLAGFKLYLRLPSFERGGRTKGFGSMALFGVSYAVASLGCTLPTFLAASSGVLRANDVAGPGCLCSWPTRWAWACHHRAVGGGRPGPPLGGAPTAPGPAVRPAHRRGRCSSWPAATSPTTAGTSSGSTRATSAAIQWSTA